ncbi:hypothetical protein HDU97_005612 [Phlyctochytrium planicorne]|nr:hypothetical protein HDU97_005612 [Phlyctochytrium planicorne]
MVSFNSILLAITVIVATVSAAPVSGESNNLEKRQMAHDFCREHPHTVGCIDINMKKRDETESGQLEKRQMAHGFCQEHPNAVGCIDISMKRRDIRDGLNHNCRHHPYQPGCINNQM